MDHKRIIHSERIKEIVKKVYASSINKYFLIGYENGVLEIRLANNL